MEHIEPDPIPAFHQGLPPDLKLPSADEPTEQFLAENFDHNDHDYRDIEAFGAFAVALLVWSSEETQRVSVMPTQDDFRALYEAGYGIRGKRFYTVYGGEGKLQRALGFYSRGFRPSPDKLLERFKWIVKRALLPEVELDPDAHVSDIISWGAVRDLLPSSRIIYNILGGDTTEVQKIFSTERPKPLEDYTFLDLYRFGAEVLREHGKPLEREELNELYGDRFIGLPSSVIRAFFGSYNRFWLEFGLVPSAKGLSEQEVEDLGIRYAIRHNNPPLTRSKIEQLSKNQELPLNPIRRIGIRTYQKRVQTGYDAYLQMRDRFVAKGVSEEVFQAACQQFERSAGFEARLEGNGIVLQKLSNGSVEAQRLLERIQNGFNLEDEGRFDWEVATAHEDMDELGFSKIQKRFVFELIPRINSREALQSYPTSSKSKLEESQETKGERFDLTDWGVQIVMRESERVVKVRLKRAFDAPAWATDVVEHVFDTGACFSDELLEVAQQKEPDLKRGDLYKILDAFGNFLNQYAPASNTNWRDITVRTLSGRRRLVQARREANVGPFVEPEERYWISTRAKQS